MARSPMTTEQMIALRDAGASVREIAERAGMTRASVYERLRRYEPPEGHQTDGEAPELEEEPPTQPHGTIDDVFARGVTVIGNHAYTELLGSEGRVHYACDAQGDVWRLEPGRRREWFGRLSNWASSAAARRIAKPKPTEAWPRERMARSGERL